jgi:hypothetical protein
MFTDFFFFFSQLIEEVKPSFFDTDSNVAIFMQIFKLAWAFKETTDEYVLEVFFFIYF